MLRPNQKSATILVMPSTVALNINLHIDPPGGVSGVQKVCFVSICVSNVFSIGNDLQQDLRCRHPAALLCRSRERRADFLGCLPNCLQWRIRHVHVSRWSDCWSFGSSSARWSCHLMQLGARSVHGPLHSNLAGPNPVNAQHRPTVEFKGESLALMIVAMPPG